MTRYTVCFDIDDGFSPMAFVETVDAATPADAVVAAVAGLNDQGIPARADEVTSVAPYVEITDADLEEWGF
jgi:hypothetical protein